MFVNRDRLPRVTSPYVCGSRPNVCIFPAMVTGVRILIFDEGPSGMAIGNCLQLNLFDVL